MGNCNREELNWTVSLTLTFAFVVIIVHNGLPQGTLLLCLNVKLKCLCSQGDNLTPLPVDDCRKEETNTSPPQGWPFQGIFAKFMALLLYFLISYPSLCYKRNWHPPIRWFIGDTNLPSSRSAGFPNKVILLASAPRLRFIGLSWGEQSELGLSNKVDPLGVLICNSLMTYDVECLFIHVLAIFIYSLVRCLSRPFVHF